MQKNKRGDVVVSKYWDTPIRFIEYKGEFVLCYVYPSVRNLFGVTLEVMTNRHIFKPINLS